MDKITLGQLVQYFDLSPDLVDPIQIVMPGHDWDDINELDANSELLEPFYEYVVTAMGCEAGCMDGKPVIRATITPDIASYRKAG